MFYALRQPPARFLTALLFIAMGGALLGCSSTKSNPDDDVLPMVVPDHTARAQEIFISANQLLDDGQWERAVSRYDQVIELDPERWDAHMNRGMALMGTLDFVGATESLALALEHGGQDEAIVYFNLGNLYQQRGLYDSAIDAYRTSMAVRGDLDYDTLLNLGAAYTFLHAYDEAELTIERAIELNPDDRRAYLSLGLIKYSNDEAPRALEIFDQLIASNPDYAEAHFNRGHILMRAQEYAEARRSFETYLRIAPDGPYIQQCQTHLGAIDRRL